LGKTGVPGENHRSVDVTHIFYYGQSYHGGAGKTFEMTSEFIAFYLTNKTLWFNTFLISSNSLSRKYWSEPQALEYHINWEIYASYAGAARLLLQRGYHHHHLINVISNEPLAHMRSSLLIFLFLLLWMIACSHYTYFTYFFFCLYVFFAGGI
jgi:hypothetical protein